MIAFKLEWNEGWRWLLLEGAVPLFGAGMLYLFFGLTRYLASNSKRDFGFAWSEAIDTLGWLYGAAIIAAQSGWKSLHVHKPLSWTIACYAAGALSLLQLLAAMVNRGEDPGWKPPVGLKLFSGLLAVAILYAGYNIATGAPPGGN